jgi:hypothetical protein
MTIWKWPLSQTILDGHFLSSLFIPYDEHHVSKDNEKVVGVKKKFTFFFEKKKESKDEASISRIDRLLTLQKTLYFFTGKFN